MPNGIIHIGAHLMEERGRYLANKLDNTIWIEANPKVFSQIDFINKEENKEQAFNFAISDIDNSIYKFYITNNGESSSILELDKHKIHHPHIHVTEVIEVESKRMDTLINENNINIKNYDFINLDIQGAELLAMKGFGNYLNNIKFIYTEVNIESLYKDCALLHNIDEFLKEFKFERVETFITQFNWGDALYIKK